MEKANAVVLFVLQASIFHKSVEISAFWQRYRSIRIGHIFHGSFRWFFTIKNHLRADDYATTVCAMKSTQLKQGRTTRRVFLNTRTYPSLFRKRFNFFVIRKATFRTQKRFQNKQYTPKLKDQPFESERTHFDTGFNNGSIAMHRPTIIFLLSHKITTVQQKTTKKQTVKTNNPHNLSIKNTQRQTKKQLRKNAMFLNIKISQTAITSEPTANTLFIKTQYNNKKQSNILPLR